ncbi:hypothetical protein B296_00003776 [Ensete ventricosum]|uniref:Uncharacterized protein n=1 Tax=Ensete ventricosum TaxID=4639 RepID=A0A427BBK2_ENSVE|nr:hypothetical protein B296_00003776 [Ensete ventricosum]
MRKVEFRSIFRASSQKFKILAIPNILTHGKSYKHSFTKKCNGHKLYAKSSFDRFFVHPPSRKFIILAIPNVLAQVWKFKILAIPNVLAHGNSCEHVFTKKYDDHKLSTKSHAKSSFN